MNPFCNKLRSNLSKLTLLGVLATICSGCTLISLRRENKQITSTGIVATRVTGFPVEQPVYVAVLPRGNESSALGFEKVQTGGLALFALPLGREYDVVAFADTNGNRRLDHSEPKATASGIRPLPLADPDLRARVVELLPSSANYGTYVGLDVPKTQGAAIPVGCGEIAKVTDAKVAPKVGTDGLWKPEDSLRAGNFGLYFTEPYDPNRTPVLFVHGIGGSPRDFAKLISSLDRTKFQAWFIAYPSGFRLGKAANGVAALASLAMEKHRCGRIHVVAHSMGGLVARAAILKMATFERRFPVGNFISISTPFGGYDAAESGVRHLRYPVPAWLDLAPGSEFLTSLWSRSLPRPTRHWLLFGYDTKQLPWLTLNNDQVVDLQSSLYIPAQEESEAVFGIKRSHEDILSSRETAKKVNEFLAKK